MRRNGWFLLGLLIFSAYFAHFVLPGLKSRFNIDDPMNLHNAWYPGGLPIVKGILLFFAPYYRPLGSLYFFSLFELFGLNPLPYHIVITGLILINSFLAYRCAALLSGSKIVGGLCALLTAYQPRMPQGVYLPAFIFDVLCFTFYFAALFFYLRIRMEGKFLRARDVLIFLILYIAALESKEMAVTLPVMILAFEILWKPPVSSARALMHWLQSSFLPCVASGFITVIYIYGKSLGQDALANNPLYRPTFTWNVFLSTQTKFIRELFFFQPENWYTNPWTTIVIWMVLFCVAAAFRSRYLKWATFLLILAPLPITFIPGRGGFCLAIPWFGWALWLAAVTAAVAGHIAELPFFKKLSRSWVHAILIILAVAQYWSFADRKNRYFPSGLMKADEYSWSLKTQLSKVLPRIKKGAQIAYYRDGTDDWSARFTTELFYRDRSVTVWLSRYNEMNLDLYNMMDYVLSFENKKLEVLKRPGQSFVMPVE